MSEINNIPGFVLKRSFGEVELYHAMALKVEQWPATNIQGLYGRLLAKRLRIRFERLKANYKEEYAVNMKAEDAIAFYMMLKSFKPHAKGEWQNDLVASTMISLATVYAPYFN